ncbi:MAG: hypothetical protein V2I38_05940 [Alcanivoracaceae bacterium]|jgi:hypothetical protein|nr:hypothetical protein [Alcanivoracaceae bacterium]
MQPGIAEGALPEDRAIYEQVCDQVLAGARRNLRIFAPDLDQQLLNRDRVSELLVRLARHNPSARIRILIADAGQAVADGHRLVYLARRLPSYVSIRVLPRDSRDVSENWLLADDRILLWRPDFRHLRHAVLHTDDPARCGALQRHFDQRWDQSLSDPALRQLHI